MSYFEMEFLKLEEEILLWKQFKIVGIAVYMLFVCTGPIFQGFHWLPTLSLLPHLHPWDTSPPPPHSSDPLEDLTET